MAHRFTRTVNLETTLKKAFALALDVDFHRESFAETGEQIIGGIAAGSMKLGDTVTWRARHFGIWWKMTSVISQYREPEFFVDEQQAGPFKHFRHEHHFKALAPGRTEMSDVVEFAAPLGLLGVAAERLLLRRHLEALIDLRNHQLKDALERTN